jgi:hypothetical protein
MLKLRQLDLELALTGAGALREDVEDERGAVEDFALEDHFEIAALRGGEFVVENDGIHLVQSALRGEFIRLAAADEGAGHWSIELLCPVADDLGTGGRGQFSEFGEGILKIPGGAGFEFKSDEEHSLRSLAGCFDQCFQTSVKARTLAHRRGRKNKNLLAHK